MAKKLNSIMLVPKTSTSGFFSFPSINAAVNAAGSGDLIVLEPGQLVHLNRVNFYPANLFLASGG